MLLLPILFRKASSGGIRKHKSAPSLCSLRSFAAKPSVGNLCVASARNGRSLNRSFRSFIRGSIHSICFVLLLAGCSTIPERELENAFRYQRLKRNDLESTQPIKSEYQVYADKAWENLEAGGTVEYVSILELGDDALLARIHLIRSARKSIDLQTFIWKDDPTSRFVFDELMKAAERGVLVRVLIDALIQPASPDRATGASRSGPSIRSPSATKKRWSPGAVAAARPHPWRPSFTPAQLWSTGMSTSAGPGSHPTASGTTWSTPTTERQGYRRSTPTGSSTTGEGPTPSSRKRTAGSPWGRSSTIPIPQNPAAWARSSRTQATGTPG